MIITILDYGVGNLKSVLNVFKHLGYETKLVRDAEGIASAECLIFPGQGAISQAMQTLRDNGLVEPLKAYIAQDKPFLGICLGFQLLFDYSEEHGGHDGLGIFPGSVTRFSTPGLKVPQMGWNALNISPKTPELSAFEGEHVYYVHSYFVGDAPDDYVFARSTYGVPFVGGVRNGNIWGVQFHPEKSGHVGLDLLTQIMKTFTHA